MAAARGFTAMSLQVHLLENCLSSRLCPLWIQTRHRNKKQRVRAPHVEKEKEKKWSKVKKKVLTLQENKQPKLSPEFLARVPSEDVWIRSLYPTPKFSLEESLSRHKEYADPSMLNNLDGFVFADMELSMKTKKKTKFLASVKGTVLLPHLFEQTSDKKKIAIFCKKEDDLQKAKTLGATYVGSEDLVKQIADGTIDKNDVEVALSTPDFLPELIPIRGLLRDIFPNKSKGTINSDIEEMWTLYTQGITYCSQKEVLDVGTVQLPLGQLKMPVEHLADNFHAYVESLCKDRPANLGPLITQIYLIAPPSEERFLLPVEKYVPGYADPEVKQEDSDSDDDDEEEASGTQQS